jgi:hypothetical protein
LRKNSEPAFDRDSLGQDYADDRVIPGSR